MQSLPEDGFGVNQSLWNFYTGNGDIDNYMHPGEKSRSGVPDNSFSNYPTALSMENKKPTGSTLWKYG